jgi:hypothetical protein
MKTISKVFGGLVAAGLIAGAAPAFAAPALTFTDDVYGTQTIDPFTGIDWSPTASAVTTGYKPDGSTIFSTTYLASAVAMLTSGGAIADIDGLTANGTLGRLEFTVVATIYETAVTDGTTASFTATGGTFDIYYDSTANADRTTGTGFTDGTRIISGTINPGYAGEFTGDGINGTGNFSFFSTVIFTETDMTKDAYINSELSASNAVATLQLGANTTGGWIAPTSWTDGGGLPAGALIFQADGNQGFSTVPEPGTLALLGLGLLGLARRSLGRKGY